MRRPLLTAGLVIVIGSLGYLGVRHMAVTTLRNDIAQFRRTLPAGTSFMFDEARPLVIHRGALFENATFQRLGLTFTAHRLVLRGVSERPGNQTAIRALRADGVTLTGAASTALSGTATARHLAMDDTVVSSPATWRETSTPGPDTATIVFEALRLDRLSLAQNSGPGTDPAASTGCTGAVSRLVIANVRLHRPGDILAEGLHLDCPAATGAAPFQSVPPLLPPRARRTFGLDTLEFHGLFLADMLIRRHRGNSAQTSKPAPPASEKETAPYPRNIEWRAEGFSTQNGVTTISFARSWGALRVTDPKAGAKTDAPSHPLAAAPPQPSQSLASQFESVIEAPRLLVSGAPPDALFATGGPARLTLTADVDPATRTATGHERLSLPGLAESTADVTLGLPSRGGNFDPPDPGEQPTPLHPEEIVLRDATLSYHDQSLIDRLITERSQRQGIAPDLLRQQIATVAGVLAAAYPGLAALPGFISMPQGRQFILHFAPPVPVRVDALPSLLSQAGMAAHPGWAAPPVLTGDVH